MKIKAISGHQKKKNTRQENSGQIVQYSDHFSNNSLKSPSIQITQYSNHHSKNRPGSDVTITKILGKRKFFHLTKSSERRRFYSLFLRIFPFLRLNIPPREVCYDKKTAEILTKFFLSDKIVRFREDFLRFRVLTLLPVLLLTT